MFARGFTMNKDLPELWSAVREGIGEITGGMGVNTVVTLAVITLCSLVFGLNPGTRRC